MVRSRTGILLVSLFAATLFACGGGDDGDDEDRVPTIVALKGDTTAGATVYKAQGCASCHGEDGKATNISPESATASAANEKEEAIEQILNGGGVMVAYKDKLTDQQVADVVAYLASLN